MSTIRLQYVHGFVDRHGKARYYFRRQGRRTPLPGVPGSAEFMAAYQQALAGTPPTAEVGAARTIAGSVNAMIVGYLGSAAFGQLAPASQQQYRRIFEELRHKHGDRSIATLERRHVALMLEAKAAKPAVARNLLRCLRLLVQHAIKLGVRQKDPTNGVRVKMPKTEGFKIGPRRTSPRSRPPIRSAASRASRWRCCSGPPCARAMSCGSGGNTSATAPSAASCSKR